VQGSEAIGLYEEHVRFMLLTEHELSGAPRAPNTNEFNSHLNLEQINKVSGLGYLTLNPPATRITDVPRPLFPPLVRCTPCACRTHWLHCYG